MRGMKGREEEGKERIGGGERGEGTVMVRRVNKGRFWRKEHEDEEMEKGRMALKEDIKEAERIPAKAMREEN